jgi:UDP-N-acetyl-D-glucosamine dehydrogenase
MYPILAKTGLKEGIDYFLGYSPEREDPGNPSFDTGTIPKVVSAMSPSGLALVNALYTTIVRTVPVSSPKVAESSKILENTYRAVNIALVNELKVVLSRLGIDVWEVIEAAKTKPFGFQAFYPGPGLGGHCIPIDPFYLTWKAKEVEYPTRFIELAGEINSNQPYYVVNNALNHLGRIGIAWNKAKALICGVAYKPDIDDIRESPALKIIDLLESENLDVSYHDPFIPVIPQTRKYKMHKKSVDLSSCPDKQYDLIIIVTDHKNLDYHRLLNLGRVIVDTRNALASRGLHGSHVYKS